MNTKLEAINIVKIIFRLDYFMSGSYEYEFTSSKFISKDFDYENYKESDRLEFYEFCLKLIKDIKVLNWKKDYTEPNILDGYGWMIEIFFDNGNKFSSKGLNKKPSRFNKMVRLFEDVFM